MTDKYSAEWVKQQVAERGSTWLALRDCSICFSPIGYSFEGDQVYFHPNCGCTRYYAPPEPRSYQYIADTLAMQSSDEIRDRIMDRLDGSPTKGTDNG